MPLRHGEVGPGPKTSQTRDRLGEGGSGSSKILGRSADFDPHGESVMSKVTGCAVGLPAAGVSGIASPVVMTAVVHHGVGRASVDHGSRGIGIDHGRRIR